MDICTGNDEFVAAINEIFSEKVPFNKVLGIRVESLSHECVKVSLQMRNELMGHYKRGMLHGGAISTIIDVAGGLAAYMGVQKQLPGETLETRLARFNHLSTIDVRIDFLRPGTGKYFVATGCALRTGKKIAVTRIELHNDQNQLIAIGTGSYTVA